MRYPNEHEIEGDLEAVCLVRILDAHRAQRSPQSVEIVGADECQRATDLDDLGRGHGDPVAAEKVSEHHRECVKNAITCPGAAALSRSGHVNVDGRYAHDPTRKLLLSATLAD